MGGRHSARCGNRDRPGRDQENLTDTVPTGDPLTTTEATLPVPGSRSAHSFNPADEITCVPHAADLSGEQPMSSSIDRRAPACLAALILSAGLVQGAPAAPPQATTFQITPDHAGVTTSGGTLALQPQPVWSVQLPGPISYPLIADRGVYVTSAGIPGGNGNGGSQLYALDAKTGNNLWA